MSGGNVFNRHYQLVFRQMILEFTLVTRVQPVDSMPAIGLPISEYQLFENPDLYFAEV